MKTLIICLISCILCNRTFAQHAATIWWGSKIGLTDIISDIETRDRLIKLPGKESNGLNIGLSGALETEYGSRYSLEYLFRMQTNDDYASVNSRGRTFKTFMNELAVSAQYDLLYNIIEIDLPVMLYVGVTIGYFISSHNFHIDSYYGQHPSDRFKKHSNGMVFHLNIEILYQINSYIQVGMGGKYGMAGNDYLEGYSTSNSSYNDHIASYTLVFNYSFSAFSGK